jgi:hypothetical protein
MKIIAAVCAVLILSLSLAFVSPGLSGQTVVENKPKEPEYANQFFLLDKAGNLAPLERETAGIKSKVKGFGFGGAKVMRTVPNEHSSVRVAGNEARFVVRLERHDIDPASVVQFYSLKTVKGARELATMEAHPFTGTKTTTQGSAIAFEAKRYGDASAVVVPLQPLPPGEYLLTASPKENGGDAVVYCFAVDSRSQ